MRCYCITNEPYEKLFVCAKFKNKERDLLNMMK